ncbi:hypothetical protein LTR48_006846 [Friedmanniomyces endolithicus]|uniref:Uncharacterized protein n=1 Tax=Rachicladosporium monterosium TaxID=1507873 RepID=A0ABR0KXV0_9PEZI|nr:hypothetical protein LTR48_006846 [Friedmanniomyces endolithicus]KAK5140340.1 hypothetical protein LTR32_006828 [Rachicladosporium monterosium]
MARHKRKPPLIITERPLDATTRKFLEKRDGVKNIKWATQEKMDAIVAKKRKAEDEELYNSSEMRRKQQRLVMEEAARMPMLRGVAEANAREFERVQKVRASRRAQRARKIAREYARGAVVVDEALGLISSKEMEEALALINGRGTDTNTARALEKVGKASRARRAIDRARRSEQGQAADQEALGGTDDKEVVEATETDGTEDVEEAEEVEEVEVMQEREKGTDAAAAQTAHGRKRRAKRNAAKSAREGVIEDEESGSSGSQEQLQTPETDTDPEPTQQQQRIEKAKAARKARPASQKAARLAQEDLDWAEGFGPAARKETLEMLAMSSETQAAEEQKWRDHEIATNRLERGKRKAAQFARGEIWWDELLGVMSGREAVEALAALVEDHEAKGERLREVPGDEDEALAWVDDEEGEERAEAGPLQNAGEVKNPPAFQAPAKEKPRPRPLSLRQQDEEDSPPPQLTRRKQARVLAKIAAQRRKADAETAAVLAVRW